MSARDRRPIRGQPASPASRPAAPAPSAARQPSAGRQAPAVPPASPARQPAPRFGQTLAESTVLTRALLPLRLFLGGTFLYAGIDKLIDPTFLRSSGAGSIAEQLASFERVSPIAGLVHLGDPFPVLVGLLIALLEIAIGLGALLGLVFRWAAGAGAALSFLFFLTASWGTHPYYYGPDLPYMFGWITLALAGHGHLYTLEDWLAEREARAASAATWPGRPSYAPARRTSATPPVFTDRERRAFLQLGILAVASIAVASLGGLWGLRRREEFREGGEGVVSPGASGAAGSPAVPGASGSSGAGSSPGAGASSAASPAASGQANLIGTMSDLKSQGALSFQDPASGDPGIVVNAGGKVVAYDAVCTHQGCTVEYDPNQVLLVCPCHGAEFDPTKSAAVVAGPAPTPLPEFPLTIDGSGRIYLKA